MRLLLLLLIFISAPALAGGSASATITISVIIHDQGSTVQAASETNVCAQLLTEDPDAYLESNCGLIVANHKVTQPDENLLLVEPI